MYNQIHILENLNDITLFLETCVPGRCSEQKDQVVPLNLTALFIGANVSGILLVVSTWHRAADKETWDIIFVNQTLDIGHTKPLQTDCKDQGWILRIA